MANVLTGIRILCGLLLLCFPAFSGGFYLFYLLGGLSDAIDGTVARRTGTASDFGSKFDTAADFVFAAAAAGKILPALSVPAWLIVWIVLIALLKIGCHLAGYVKYHKFRTVHSVLNRVCGGTAFVVPLLLGSGAVWQAKAAAVIAVCIFATVTAIAEGLAIFSNTSA